MVFANIFRESAKRKLVARERNREALNKEKEILREQYITSDIEYRKSKRAAEKAKENIKRIGLPDSVLNYDEKTLRNSYPKLTSEQGSFVMNEISTYKKAVKESAELEKKISVIVKKLGSWMDRYNKCAKNGKEHVTELMTGAYALDEYVGKCKDGYNKSFEEYIKEGTDRRVKGFWHK